MRKLIANRWFLGAVGVACLSLIVWFLGDAVTFGSFSPLESPLARTLVLGLLAGGWIAFEAGRLWWMRRSNQKLLDGMTGAPAAQEDPSALRSREEIAQLRTRFEQAIATLKKARFGDKAGGQAYLYQMPWYVFVGAPGSGKTTALTNCGLRFPLAEGQSGQALAGVGGTRNCDWWFTDQAVFLDTAGRYATQESDQKADAAAWLGFLKLLKKSRPRAPLNGAIITVSVADLLTQTPQERERYAAAMRKRIGELYETLGVRFPLYLLVTKTDLLAGFNEYFANLGHEARAQVWGMSFDLKAFAQGEGDFEKAFIEEFDRLRQRLERGLITRLQEERDVERRPLVYGFPEQFAAMGPLLGEFIAQAFQGSRFAQQPMLRGVYFSSGTQEGSPIDRVLGAVARAFKLERQVLAPTVATGKSYFLTRLLQEVVFREAGLVGLNERRERLVGWLVRGSYAAIALLSVAIVSAWAVSYRNNRAVIAEAQPRLEALAERTAGLAPADDMMALLPILDELAGLPYGYAHQPPGVPLSHGFGLSQGDKLGRQSVAAYRRALRDALLPRVALRLEDLLRGDGDSDLKYLSLKAYLMLFDDGHVDAKWLEQVVMADWGPRVARAGGPEAGPRLEGHLRAAFSERPIRPGYAMDQALVDRVRHSLARVSLSDRIYAMTKVMAQIDEPAGFRLSDALGPQGSQVFVRASGAPLSAPLPGLFTVEGYRQRFDPLVGEATRQMLEEESWVLGGRDGGARADSRGELLGAVGQRYLEDYIRVWDGLLEDVQLKPAGSISDTVMYARVLSDADSPLKRLALAVARETKLGAAAALARERAKGVIDKATEKAASLGRDVAGRVLGGRAEVGAGMPAIGLPASPETRVDDHFSRLHQLVGSGAADQAMPVDQTIVVLRDFYNELVAMEQALKTGTAQIQLLPSAIRLKAEAERLPAPLQAPLKSLVSGAFSHLKDANSEALAGAMADASAFCEKALKGRFPIARTARAESSIGDFARVFAPGGDLDRFFKERLGPMVDTSAAVWRPKAGSENAIKVAAGALRQFQNADAIRTAFFRGGSPLPQAQGELHLLASDVGPLTVELDEQRFDMAPGKPGIRIDWPSRRPGSPARILSTAGGTLESTGEWALFRLIQMGKIQGSGERLKIAYVIEGKPVVFELRTIGTYNPFNLKELGAFACPSQT